MENALTCLQVQLDRSPYKYIMTLVTTLVARLRRMTSSITGKARMWATLYGSLYVSMGA